MHLANFAYQYAISFTVYALLARWYVMPLLQQLSLYDALQVLLVPSLFRHVGASLLAPGVVPRPSSQAYAWAILLQDLLCLVAALAAIVAVRNRSRWALPLCWSAAIIGLVLYVAFAVWGYFDEAYDHLYAHWYVACYYVPLLAVLQVLLLFTLVKRQHEIAV